MKIEKPIPITEDRLFPLMDYANTDDEMDFLELLWIVWQSKWLVILLTSIFAIGSIVFAFSQPNVYHSSVLLAPVNEENDKMGQLVSKYGGLASLAGVNLGSGSSSPADLALAVLTSRLFLTDFVNRHDLKVPLFAAKKWDPQSGELVLDANIYNSEKKLWVREVDRGKLPEPTNWEVFEAFSELLTIDSANDSGLVTVRLEFVSPMLAKQWVEWLVADLNKEMREKDLADVEMKINYLENNLSEVDLADVQTVFYQLIEEQLKTKMLAQLHSEYVFKTVDPAVVAEEKFGPNRAIIIFSGTLLGGMLALMLVFAIHAAKKIRNEFKKNSGLYFEQ